MLFCFDLSLRDPFFGSTHRPTLKRLLALALLRPVRENTLSMKPEGSSIQAKPEMSSIFFKKKLEPLDF